MIGKLDAVLSSELEEEKAERKLFSKSYITEHALRKARIYAEKARNWSDGHVECYGFLLGNGNKRSRVVEDVYFASDQDVNSAHVAIPAQAVIKAGREIRETGRRVLGWWHSHADMSPFHSGTDDANHQTVAYQITPSNYVTIYEDMEFLNNDIKKTRDGDSTIFVCQRSNTSRRLEMIFEEEFQDNPLAGMPLEKLIVRIPHRVSYAYSIVVNALGAPPYSEIATLQFCNSCHRDEYEKGVVPVKILVDFGAELELDEGELEKEVKSKLKIPSPVVVSFPDYAGCVAASGRGKKGKKRYRIVQVSPTSTIVKAVPEKDFGQEDALTLDKSSKGSWLRRLFGGF